jgi:hypothetical protein
MGAPRRSTSRLSQRRVALLRNSEKQKKKEEHEKREAEKRKRKPIDVRFFLSWKRNTHVQRACSQDLFSHTSLFFVCFQINVQLLTGRSITVSVSPDDTIEELTLKILAKEGINPDQQRLLYSGLRLHEDDTVDDCRIQEQSRLFLTLRLRGG